MEEYVAKINTMYTFFNSNENLKEKRTPTWDERDKEVLSELLNEYVVFYNNNIKVLKEVSKRFLVFGYAILSKYKDKYTGIDNLVQELENVLKLREANKIDDINGLDDIFAHAVFFEYEVSKLERVMDRVISGLFVFTFDKMHVSAYPERDTKEPIRAKSEKWELIQYKESILSLKPYYIYYIKKVGTENPEGFNEFLNDFVYWFKYFYDNIEDLAVLVRELRQKFNILMPIEELIPLWLSVKNDIFKEKELWV